MTKITGLLHRAQQLCEQRGVRLTPQRTRVYDIIANCSRAITAYELLDVLRETEPQAKPPNGVSCARLSISTGVCA